MLDTETKRRIDSARDILVGKVPDPKSQVEQITIALIYKFMDDMDAESEELGGKRKFFTKEFTRYGWAKLMAPSLGGHEMLGLYGEGISRMPENPGIPPLFRDIFKNAYLPYRDPETLKSFLKIINEFSYDHSEKLGDAFEYLLSVLGSQGDAGQFRTPRHIIDFMVEVLAPKKGESILDPACGTAGFLISAYKHILRNNSSKPSPPPSPTGRGSRTYRGGFDFSGLKKRARELRQTQTDAEMLLWDLLRDRRLAGIKFRRQHQFGDYICDFYSHEAELVIECDGAVHMDSECIGKDRKRDAYMKALGLNVMRFENSKILNMPEAVLDEIESYFSHKSDLPSTAGRGDGGEGGGSVNLLTPDEKGRLAMNFKGYDISPDMVRLSLVNLYLHGFTDPHIYEYDTLTSEERWNDFADVILANPPFMSPKGGIKPHKRFSIQAKRSEVLFVDYMAEHLTPSGRAAIIVPEGIIFQSQTAYKELRKMLVDTSLVAVISLPAGCFNPYSGVKTSILILDKSLARQCQTIAFFKVENDGFGLGAQRRAFDKNDLPQVQAELESYLQALRAKKPVETLAISTGLIVPKEKVAANDDYKLSGERYREGGAKTNIFPLVRIADVCSVNPRKSQLSELKKDTRVSFVPMADLNEHHIAFQSRDEKQLAEVSASYTYFEDNDVLLAKVTPCFENGKAGIARGLLNGIGFGSSEFYVLRSNGKVLPEWIYFCVMHPIFRDAAVAQMTGTGGLQRVPRDYVENFKIPLPPLDVQKEIVAEIEGYQKVIDGARAVLDNYRPHIPIHPDWPMVELGEVCSFKRGPFGGSLKKDIFVKSGYAVYEQGHAIASDFTKFRYFIDQGKFGEMRGFRVKPGELIMSCSGTMGKVAIIPPNAPAGIINQALLKLTPKDEIIGVFLKLWMESDNFQRSLSDFTYGATIKNVASVQILKGLHLPLPPLATQKAIVAEIEAEQELVAANRELIVRFEKKIQSTLARIWGGENSLCAAGD